jgi:hypothetical protein
MSPTVLDLCAKHNIRYIFLPENSTHIMQPLDVAVFGPMKRHWREKVLSAWKEECERKGENFATIPKQVFPTLLKELLESKDYGPAIRSGFETTGLYPFSMEKALSKLPVEVEEREVESAVQRTLLNTLSNMRYNAPANKAAARPKRSERLPPGASYTCGPEKVVRPSGDGDSSNSDTSNSDSDSSSSSSSESEDEGEEETRRTVAEIVDSLEEDDEDEDDPAESESGAAVEYPVESFVVAVYQNQWYVGQVQNKEEEPEAEEGDHYVILSFMERIKDNNSFKWPLRPDILNMLKEDILFPCKHPIPTSSTSSTRVNAFQLSKEDFDKANKMFLSAKAFFPTKISKKEFSFLIFSSYWVFLHTIQYRTVPVPMQAVSVGGGGGGGGGCVAVCVSTLTWCKIILVGTSFKAKKS